MSWRETWSRSKNSKILSPGIARSHHVLGVKHLLGQFRNSQSPDKRFLQYHTYDHRLNILEPVLLTSPCRERRKTRHEEMQPVKSSHLHLQKMHSPWEGHHIDGQLAQISIELSREPQTGRDARHGERHQVVQITVCGRCQLQGPEATWL